MTSKEYLQQIATTEVIDCTYNDNSKKRIADIFSVGIAVIEKDLEVLEILERKNVDIQLIKEIMLDKIGFDYYPYNNLTNEEFNKIKDWLENGKNDR